MWLATRRQKFICAFHCWMSVALCVKYEELQQLGVSCPPLDTCGSIRHRIASWYTNTCSCDKSCVQEHTCCADSAYADFTLLCPKESCTNTISRSFICYGNHLWFVTHCSPSWNGSSSVKELCEGDATMSSNLYMMISAASNESGFIYSNYFCAVCNYDHQQAVLWNVNIDSKRYPTSLGLSEEEDFSHELVYERGIEEWGYWTELSRKGSVFVSVNVNIDCYNIERDFLLAKQCRNDIVWSCADGWEDDSIREKCESYMALLWRPAISSQGVSQLATYYRNVHCAICNNVTEIQELMCHPFNITTYRGGYGGGGGAYGGGGGIYISNLLGYKLQTDQLSKKECHYVPDIDQCRPVISRKKKS